MARWWEWLGRILSTFLAMAVAGVVLLSGVSLALLPSTVSDWHSQVVVPIYIALGIAVVVSVLVGILFWRYYPSLLRGWGIGWGPTDTSGDPSSVS
ncbi:MAG: hypothetical protein ABI869_00635 [Actinomycetota bacterium]